jgi:hypothetical protein
VGIPARIVLTGGGKTALMGALRDEDRAARRWVWVPEAAPLLFGAGFSAAEVSFQAAVVRLQTALEDTCAAAALPGQVLLCHRGSLDALAYWLRRGWSEGEFFRATATSRAEQFRRYDGVIHLQTAAVGAPEHYRRWPDARRPEAPEEAAEIDRLCARAWEGHPRYVRIENAGRDWPNKARAARDVLAAWLTSLRG